MKIVSNFIDYYDLVEGNKKSPVYNRKTEIINDVQELYREDLLKSKIETIDAYCSGDIWLTGYTSYKSSLDYIKVIPVLVGIAGEYHYYIEYYNSVLNIRKICYNYTELEQYYKNVKIKRTFDLYYSGLLRSYCRQQFGCVNFILKNDSVLSIIKEPCLTDYIEINRFLLTSQEMYSKIESFIIKTKELDKEYKKLKPSEFLKRKKLNRLDSKHNYIKVKDVNKNS